MSKVYKIAIDARRIRSSTGRYARQLLKYLQEIDQDNEYHVIIHKDDFTHWAPSAKNFKLHVIGHDYYGFGEQIGFLYFLMRLKPDLVHFTMPQQPMLYLGKKVSTIHDLTLVNYKNIDGNQLIYNIKQSVFKLLIHRVARSSKYIITPTKYVQEDVLQYTAVDRNKVKVTYEAAEKLSETHSKAIKEFKDKKFIMYVGNAYPYKNIKNLINAHQILIKEQQYLHLVLVGKTDYFWQQLQDYSSEINAKNVHFTGFVSDENLDWLYEKAQAYIFPSLSEGFGLPGLEAMQYDIPVISSNATCLPEVYGDGAEYFDPNDTDNMAEVIDKVLKDKKLQKNLVSKAKKQREKYSWLKMAKQTHEIYLKSLD